MERLIILSDLWGKEKSEWIDFYIEGLKHHFEIKYYDCCELGGVDKTIYTQENLHHQFINGGIEKAVQKLIELEKEEINILAFSIGGTIAWKYGLKCSNIKSLHCISSTRLRYEKNKPRRNGRDKACLVSLQYGEKDPNKPNKKWMEKLRINPKIIKKGNHEIYQDEAFAKALSNSIVKKINNKK